MGGQENDQVGRSGGKNNILRIQLVLTLADHTKVDDWRCELRNNRLVWIEGLFGV